MNCGWEKKIKRGRGRLELTKGHAQQQHCDQQDWAGGHSPCAVVVVMTVTLVGPVAVVSEATLHLGSGVSAVSLLAERLVRARLHHGVLKRGETHG